MGTFYTHCIVQNHSDRKRQFRIPKILVDTGSEYTWIPEAILERIGVAREKKDVPFMMANGQQITRSVGFAIIRIDKVFTVDEVVFAEKGDLVMLGARTIGRLKLAVDSKRMQLAVDESPYLAAAAAEQTPI